MGLFDQTEKRDSPSVKPTQPDRQAQPNREEPTLELGWGSGPVGAWLQASGLRAHNTTHYTPPSYQAGSGPKLDRQSIRPWRKRALIATSIVAATILTLLGIAMIITTIAVPNPMALRKDEPAPTVRVLAADGSLLVERGQPYDYIPVDLLPKHTIEAIIATEDHRFFEHWGLDPWGLFRAAFTNLRAGRYAQGGSTLTQQLAKNLFLTSERRLSRKLEELYLALWLELRLSKSDILELYINRVYFGGGAYGIEAAAQRYFGKSARKLNLTESAVLAGLLKAPSKFSPLSSPTLARNRAKTVINRMRLAGYLTDAEELTALSTEIAFNDVNPTREVTGLEYAVDHILERLPALQGTHAKAIIVETTIDAKLQRTAQNTISAIIATESEVSQASQAAMVLLEPSGAITALVGGAAYADSQFNRAIKAKRQPGSTFKPFVYLAALEAGMKPDSQVFDLPITINSYSPRNENGTFKGAMTMRQALAQSVNSVAVRLMVDVGTKRTIATANRLGVKSELRDTPSLALGTSETTLLELTSAYGVLANGGYAVEPHIIRAVKTSAGELLYQRPAQLPRRVVSVPDVGAMNDMLNSALISGTGRRAAIARHPAAGKTGTSQDFRDAWFIGYTAHYIGGVWFGNDNSKPMNRIVGGSLPARVWRDVMAPAHDTKTPAPLPGTETTQATNPGSKDGQPRADADPIADLMKADLTIPGAKIHLLQEPKPAALKPTPQQRQQLSKPSTPKRIDESFLAKALVGLPPTTNDTQSSGVSATAYVSPSVPEQQTQAAPVFNPRALREALAEATQAPATTEAGGKPKQLQGIMSLGIR